MSAFFNILGRKRLGIIDSIYFLINSVCSSYQDSLSPILCSPHLILSSVSMATMGRLLMSGLFKILTSVKAVQVILSVLYTGELSHVVRSAISATPHYYTGFRKPRPRGT